jgi:hypothetical protein
MRLVGLTLVFALAPGVALADKAAADACAAKLTAKPKLIYDVSYPKIATATIPDVLKAETTKLVQAGQVSRAEARPAAEAAGACLKLAK